MNTTSSPPAPVAYDLPDAAKAAGLSEAAVRAAVLEGRLSARVGPGGRLLVLSNDLSAFVASLPRLQPAAEAEEDRVRHAKLRHEALRSHGRAIVARVYPSIKPKGGAK